jgi:outer membrane protein assembly factor BamB
MHARTILRPLLLLATAAIAIAACGGGTASLAVSTATDAAGAIPATPAAAPAGSPLLDWPEFGLDPQRNSTSNGSTSITAANLTRLRHTRVALSGTIDSAPIYLHGVSVNGASHDVLLATSSYGRTFAVDASSGRVLWTFTPAGYGGWAGSSQVTTATPLADPDRRSVYTASPDGRIHKLAVSDGREQAGWPVSITRRPQTEKIASALNVDGPYVVAVTGGYFGDAPPYQGHVVLLDRAGGRIAAVYNTLCSDRRAVIVPSSCAQSDAAIWAREGAVVEPGGRRLLVATGNAPYNGRTDFGDSVLELNVPGLTLRQAYTPTDQARLNADDTDLGSSAPALLGSGLAAIAGKDGVLRLLRLSRLDGRAPSAPRTTGGEVQTLSTPGGAALFSSPAVWHHGGRVTLFVADNNGTGAYALRGSRLHAVWTNSSPGTSPVVAGGLLYVYDPGDGGVKVYRPASPRPLAVLSGGAGHWSSVIVADGRVAVGEGSYMDHSEHGVLDIWSVR